MDQYAIFNTFQRECMASLREDMRYGFAFVYSNAILQCHHPHMKIKSLLIIASLFTRFNASLSGEGIMLRVLPVIIYRDSCLHLRVKFLTFCRKFYGASSENIPHGL